MTLDEAVGLIGDGDCIGVNAFLALANPVQLHEGIAKRFKKTGSPNNLSVFCSAGFGNWEADSPCEGHIAAGAVSKIVLGHMGSMPSTTAKILSGELEAYNLPLGVMSHMVRAAAAGMPFYATKIGVNLFVDPKYKGYRLNSRSNEEWVREVAESGERYLLYKTPKLDIALIKGTSCDPSGNISFEKECATLDALSLAQAVKRRGGKVIVQVERTIEHHLRPRNVIIPGILVDAVAVCPQQGQVVSIAGYEPSFSGDKYVKPCDIGHWAAEHEANSSADIARTLVGRRAYRELKRGDIANIGIGIPESVALLAAKEGLLQDITLTVESGAMGGLPAFGRSFGATVGADTIYDMAQQFDFYDGGGLDVCFIGALEIDERGNVNGHYSPKKLAGIGGFANITQSTRKVVFCATFTSGGLEVSQDAGDNVKILREGKYKKFVNRVASVSFSAENALNTGQEIFYVTERCVFKLHKEGGLLLDEVSPGIDIRRDILDLLPFDVRIAKRLI